MLTIKNFGLIDSLSIDLSRGLTVLTGETGAGKSILIDGLRFCLGEKISASAVRDPNAPCRAELVIEISSGLIREYPPLEELTAGEDQLIINRTLLPDGKTKARINGLAVTLAQLKALGDHLMDFHGPHDHQMILSPEAHRGILDRLCAMDTNMAAYTQIYEQYMQLKHERQQLGELAATRRRDIEMLEHQIKELSAVPLDEEQYDLLIEQQTKLNNAEKLYEAAQQMLAAIERDDTGVSEGLASAFPHAKTLNRIDPATERFTRSLADIQDSVSVLAQELRGYLDSLSFEPEEAAQINRRCDLYYDIKRKYGPEIAHAAAYLEQTREKYERIVHAEENTRALDEKAAAAEIALRRSAAVLTKHRLKAGQALKRTIEQELKELGIQHVKFDCRIEKSGFTAAGADAVTFYISPNKGEDLKPLADIVSSGEAARLMLALKKALIEADPIPVLIFDEIDAQIGGRLGTVIGKKLKELSRNRQVIAITHLPQIASFADTHLKIVKKVAGERTVTHVERLDADGTLKELAQMMSGERETGIALDHARELVNMAKRQRHSAGAV
ncbi:MAG TPA: DNA repair protein RecN [Candidatus Omnitrophota bacterium]|nr:DNA repair protein RecN [Candidatus Omnitrophota bacterium]HNQ50858.1 DNA repair protein RecN [Candidatus Omnitrophota bacterium]HQO37939.1 DNA repair protein RecN [Candidatus Omnitrophota bacterium]HQQ05454.1 DNA repair protein RecN [Candidatus Omnitrophota bacterium]